MNKAIDIAAKARGVLLGNLSRPEKALAVLPADDTPDIVLAALESNADTCFIVHVMKEFPDFASTIAKAHKDNVTVIATAGSLCKRETQTFQNGGEHYALVLEELAQQSIWLLYIAAYAGIEAAVNVRGILNTDTSNQVAPAGEVMAAFTEWRGRLINKAGDIAVDNLSKRVDADRLSNEQLLRALKLAI